MEMNLTGAEVDAAKLWHSLCVQLTGLPEDSVHSLYENTLVALGSSFEQCEEDETKVVERIIQSFIRKHKEKEAVRFSDLYRRLRSPALNGVLRKRPSVLSLLLALQDASEHQGAVQLTMEPLRLSRQAQLRSGSRPDFWPVGTCRLEAPESHEPATVCAVSPQVVRGVGRVGHAVLRDVLFCLQGISSSMVQFPDGPLGHCTVDPEGGQLSGPLRRLVCRLVELGRLHAQVDGFCRPETARRGLLCEAFVAALRNEIAEYYRLLALLDAQLGSSEEGALTLHRVMVWISKPLKKLRLLGDLVQACAGLKGGNLASELHTFLANGDPEASTLVRRLLLAVLEPWYGMLCRWVQTGQLEDVHHEFFIATNAEVPVESLWHDKYYLRKNMVPSFLSEEQARKILCTGKAVNFLLHVCQDQPQQADLPPPHPVECLLDGQREDSFLEFLEQTYHTSNRRVLSVLNTQFKFKEHLQAMRQFLLLGQGDFVRQLMDILDKQLNEKVECLYQQVLDEALSEAVRTTNAQFVDPDILERLAVHLLHTSPSDTGLDVFSLYYRVDGPIGMVFTPYCMSLYLRLFNHLWRTKHMEYMAAAAWKQQTVNLKVTMRNSKRAPEIVPVLHQCHIVLSEMMHFMQQVQYYLVFEVIECAWAELESRVEQAQDLDQVIHAHDDFLAALMTRALLDDESREIQSQLRAIFDRVLDFTKLQGVLLSELSSGTSSPGSQTSLRMISDTYQHLVQQFLLSLSKHEDAVLQALGFRLDFSEFYKQQNHLLRTSMTLQSRRQILRSTVQV